MGAAIVLERRRIYVFGGQAMMLLLLNVAITLFIPGISIGGHFGGLAGGLIGLFKHPWPMADFDSVVLVRSSPQERQILWNVEEGGMAGMFGRILVLEASLEQGSEVVYESFGSAGKRFPAWVVKLGLHIVLPGVLGQLSERLQAQFPGPAGEGP